jgi:curli biogenesis system outer membrane secretion channel CsgG
MDPARASRRLLIASLLLVAAGCSTEFERRYAEAEQLRMDAAATGAEWLGTGKLLEAAVDAKEQGDSDTALELVEEAKFQAEAAIRQAEHESGAWRERVVR